MAGKIKYAIGDVFSLILDEKGLKGYGRIIKLDKPSVLIELYKIKPEKEYSLDELRDAAALLTIWSVDHGFKKNEWNVIGNIPLDGEIKEPDFWTTNAITKKIMLIRGEEQIEITKDEIENAQPYGIFGQGAVRIKYVSELKKYGLYSRA